ncbi:protein arginine N-methyltransferase 5 [Acyrthosiphon pisum]|uniref:Protein arginine N-methyltransferase n=1 Tax=Acyrthosiphon pisum TaxID=7029 RepID=A0A8R1W6C1_ACYPI|nr:protein arginine N-methyltransferase 5 [Acyrthosiphon pisum]XP_003246708.1 protein arginine N-methyltransferase 5 [Acyrthosiphon pisum]XP_008186331.1 protein arginine N-methyltransferase 5 [Acyrthosiphon pisum]|eukprot:XP_001945001.1 PREDICTED: protein arginine N-methyltransferase 5 [Acyrthosiphon pisum]
MSIKDVRFGFNFLTDTNIKACMDSVKELELTFACLPVSSLRLKSNSKVLDPSSTVMNPEFCQKWCHCVVASISLPNVDSEIESTRLENQKSFTQDISWASFLNVYCIMFELPLHGDVVNLVRLLDNQIDIYINSAVLIQFWALVPIVNLKTDPWKKWTKFISSIRNVNRIKLALEIGPELPSDEELDRWLGEPVAALVIQSKIFMTNKKGYPVLSKPHQKFIKKMFNIGCQIVISGQLGIKQQFNYLGYLYQNTTSLTPYSSDFISGFEDYLQTPLQPLKHNLQSYVYETFEQDPIKYYEYQRAISKALIDKYEDKVLVVYVVGAGRGPLVDATFEAAKDANIKVKISAIEKNENALPSLFFKNKEKWENRVTIINEDMRLWNPSEKCDILVSELLGSFGDNELSPECLDGAQNYLKKDGISIPSSYTSYLGPIQSRKLHAEISSIRKNNDNCNFQKPYVVQLNNVYSIAPPKPLFTFVHPKKNLEESNNRDGFLKFNISQDCVLHGFAGYFETVLYKDVRLSIVPESFSDGMFSWFPAYFPLIKPILLDKGEEIQINFWRCSNKFKVWYEWCMTRPYQSIIHNIKGEMYFMSL